MCERCPNIVAVHLANTSGCGEESFVRSDTRGIRSKGKVDGQLGVALIQAESRTWLEHTLGQLRIDVALHVGVNLVR